jgi:hypothetical protein
MLYTNQINLKKITDKFSATHQRKISLKVYSEKNNQYFPVTDIKYIVDPNDLSTIMIGLISSPESKVKKNLFELIDHLKDLKKRKIYKTTFKMLFHGDIVCEIDSLKKEKSEWCFIARDTSFDTCVAVHSEEGSNFSKENGFSYGKLTPFESSSVNKCQEQAIKYLMEWLADFEEKKEIPEILDEIYCIKHCIKYIAIGFCDAAHLDEIKGYIKTKIELITRCELSSYIFKMNGYNSNPILDEASYLYENFDEIFKLRS